MPQRIGLNMYSLRTLCQGLHELQRTLDKVAEAGYRHVQVSGIRDIDPEDIVSAVHAAGLNVCATHLGWDRFVEDVHAVIDLHRLYGTIHTAVGSLPAEYRNADGISRFLHEARLVLPHIADAGMDFSYHNHSHEFERFSGTTWIDAFYEQGSVLGVKFELDTYWVAAGGADPADYIERYRDYESIVHVKDMVVTANREQRFAPVGSGNLNWRRIFQAIRNAPIDYVIVEQDDHYGGDEIRNVAESFRFLADHGFSAD